jgi:hypothetical protein
MGYAMRMLRRMRSEKKSEMELAANSAAIFIHVLVSVFIELF